MVYVLALKVAQIIEGSWNAPFKVDVWKQYGRRRSVLLFLHALAEVLQPLVAIQKITWKYTTLAGSPARAVTMVI